MVYLVLLTGGMPDDESEDQTTKTLFVYRNKEEAVHKLMIFGSHDPEYEYQVRVKEIGYVDTIQIPIEPLKEMMKYEV